MVLSVFLQAREFPNRMFEVMEYSVLHYDEMLSFGNKRLKTKYKGTTHIEFAYQSKLENIDENVEYQKKFKKLSSKNENFCEVFLMI